MQLSVKETQIILDALREKHGPGYSGDEEVGMLQAKLSINLEIANKRENP